VEQIKTPYLEFLEWLKTNRPGLLLTPRQMLIATAFVHMGQKSGRSLILSILHEWHEGKKK